MPPFASSRNRSRISRRPTGSTPSVGSSSSSTLGEWISAVASPRRWVIPLENFFTRTSIHCESFSVSRSWPVRLAMVALSNPDIRPKIDMVWRAVR